MNEWQTDRQTDRHRKQCMYYSNKVLAWQWQSFRIILWEFVIKILMLQSRSLPGTVVKLVFFFCENTHLNVLAAFETNVEYPDKAKGYANVFCCMFFWMEIRIQLVLLCHKSGREREGERAKNLNVKYNQSSKEKYLKKNLNGERGYWTFHAKDVCIFLFCCSSFVRRLFAVVLCDISSLP